MAGTTEGGISEAPSGERFDPALMRGHLIEAEHLSRYAWATQFATGQRVLDAACGTGYGTALLAAAGAREVTGVDRDEKVVAAASEAAPEGVRFETGDLHALPYQDGSFDLVVCFEAIEHVPEPGQVLDQLARVLAPDGLLIVSTPNRDVYTPGNPFHLRELTPNELEGELERRFHSVALRRQHTWIASGIFDDEAFARGGDEEVEGIDTRKLGANRPGEETYTIGLASDGELPVGRPTVALTGDLDLRDWSSRLDAAELAMLTAPAGDGNPDAETELLRREVDELRRQLAAGEAELARFTEIEEKLASARKGLTAYDELAASHAEIVNSKSWRLTGLLRRLRAKLRLGP